MQALACGMQAFTCGILGSHDDEGDDATCATFIKPRGNSTVRMHAGPQAPQHEAAAVAQEVPWCEDLPTSAQSDDCILCCENIAEVKFPCGHRIVCQHCAEQMDTKARAKGRLPLCPIDRKPFECMRRDLVQYHPVRASSDLDGMERLPLELVAEGVVGYKLRHMSTLRPGEPVTEAPALMRANWMQLRPELDLWLGDAGRSAGGDERGAQRRLVRWADATMGRCVRAHWTTTSCTTCSSAASQCPR